jgi:hypothetical protein
MAAPLLLPRRELGSAQISAAKYDALPITYLFGPIPLPDRRAGGQIA